MVRVRNGLAGRRGLGRSRCTMIIQVDDAVTEHDCRRLIAIYDQHAHRGDVKDGYGNVVLYQQDLPDVADAVEILETLARQCAETARRRLDIARPIYPETITLTRL